MPPVKRQRDCWVECTFQLRIFGNNQPEVQLMKQSNHWTCAKHPIHFIPGKHSANLESFHSFHRHPSSCRLNIDNIWRLTTGASSNRFYAFERWVHIWALSAYIVHRQLQILFTNYPYSKLNQVIFDLNKVRIMHWTSQWIEWIDSNIRIRIMVHSTNFGIIIRHVHVCAFIRILNIENEVIAMPACAYLWLILNRNYVCR